MVVALRRLRNQLRFIIMAWSLWAKYEEEEKPFGNIVVCRVLLLLLPSLSHLSFAGWLATAKEVIVLYSVAARGANKRWDVKLTRKNLTAIFNAAPPPKREKMISYFSIKWRGAPSSHHPAKRFNNHTRTGQERNAFKAARSTCRAIRVCSRWHDSDHY